MPLAPRPSARPGCAWPISSASWRARDEARGWTLSAGEKYRRASSYLITAERLQAHDAPGRLALYRRQLELFLKGSKMMGDKVERVTLPYEGKEISALWYPADGLQPGQRAPVLVQLNGLDSTKEMKHLVGLPKWMAQRGVSSLVVDQPGTGEALRLHGLTARFDAEHWAGRVVDYLESRDDVDPRRIGLRRGVAGRLLLPACGGLRAALCRWRGAGAPTTTGATCRRSRLEREGDVPGAALLGPRALGVGREGHGRLHAPSPRTCTWTAWSRRSACPSW
jgi:hypothetical protein